MKKRRKLLVTGLFILVFFNNDRLIKAESFESKGEVGFLKNSTSPPIVNPLDPDVELEIDTEGSTSELSIDYASDLEFGSNQISTSDKTYYAAADVLVAKGSGKEVLVPNFVQVTDNRGTKVGWTLSVTASDFTTGDGRILKGAYITFNHANTYDANSTGDAPTVEQSIALEQVGTPYPMMIAANGQGSATWGIYFAGGEDDTGDYSVTLSVPGESTKMADTYTSTLTWNLAETPY